MRNILKVILLLILASCGKDRMTNCKNREHMRVQCQAETIPHYGRPYAQDYCNRTYELDRCY